MLWSSCVLSTARAASPITGAIDDDREARNIKRRHLSLALDEVLAGKPVSTPKTDVHA
jgi:hypothetical protein